MSNNETVNNPRSIFICGESGSGKSFSLASMADQKGVLYLNCEYGKPLPFRHKFKEQVVTDPKTIISILQAMQLKGEDNKYRFIIIDTASFMMDLFESTHIVNATDKQKGWLEYGQFFKNVLVEAAKLENTFLIVLGHLERELDETAGVWRTFCPVKGSLKKKGLEAYFTTVINCQKMPVKTLEEKTCDLLTIMPEEAELGYKHVFQTRTTKNTLGDRIRAPKDMFASNEVYIDNDIKPVLKRLVSYYSA